jgi:hypothetical protein
MAYAVIHFVEDGVPRATLCRESHGEPTGEGGVMNVLGEFIHEWSPVVMREGSPGALRMAMLFLAREREAGRPLRLVGGEGELGIRADEVSRLAGRGYVYEVSFGRPGERALPTARALPLPPRDATGG